MALALGLSNASAENALQSVPSLKNRYFGVRHGESFSNVEKRVCSSMRAGVDPKNGLTDAGKEQVRASARKWVAENADFLRKEMAAKRVRIVTSPFSRTRDTAKILEEALVESYRSRSSAPGPWIFVDNDKDLRERYFGDLEGKPTPDGFWEKLNAKDEADPSQGADNVEKVTDLESRVSRVVRRLEKRKVPAPEVIFLVSHSDPLSSLQNALEKKPPGAYVRVPRFKTGEIRELKIVSP